MSFKIASNTVITDFNMEILCANTPLRSEKEALEILTLINPVDTESFYKIIDGAVPSKPEDTYFARLYNALILAEL